MKKKIYLLAICFAFCLTAKTQSLNDTIILNRAMERFLNSRQVLIKDTHWSHALSQWHFKTTVEGNTMQEPPALTELKNIFSQCSVNALTAYSCSAGELHPYGYLGVLRDDNYYDNISGMYSLDEDMNLRLLEFSDNGYKILYGLKWRILPITDHNGKQWCTCEGVLFRLDKNTWKTFTYIKNPTQDTNSNFIPLDKNKSNTYKYELLQRQVDYLVNNCFDGKKKEKKQQDDVTCIMIYKLCSKHDGQLTSTQYESICRSIDSALSKATELQQKALSEAKSSLQKKTHQNPSQFVVNIDYVRYGCIPDNRKKRRIKSYYNLQDKSITPTVTMRIKGQGGRRVTIKSVYPQLSTFETPMSDFDISEEFIKNQLICISDKQKNTMLLFADGVDTEVDLEKMIVRGSELNERFVAAQKQRKAIEAEVRKYAYIDSDDDCEVIDRAGYDQLRDEIHQFHMRLMEENKDNLIPVWILVDNFTAMNYEELSRFMRKDCVYADHVALQPIWLYYEGLQKRQPGTMYTDIACKDSTGQHRHLSEYVGHGDYVVLHFWNAGSMVTRSGAKYCKQIAKEYKDKNLRVVAVAAYGEFDEWKKYIQKRNLTFEHLIMPEEKMNNRYFSTEIAEAYGVTTMPETILFGPDGRIVTSEVDITEMKDYLKDLLK